MKNLKNWEKFNEASVPSNILEFAKERGITNLVRKVARWVEGVGKRVSGGTAIGKYYDTLILDIKYQGSEIRIDTNEETVKLYGEIVSTKKEFEKVYYENNEKL